MPRRCALGCKPSQGVCHVFPNPKKFSEQFKAWVRVVTGQDECDFDYKKLRVCDRHFTEKDRNRYNRLNALAVPSLFLLEHPVVQTPSEANVSTSSITLNLPEEAGHDQTSSDDAEELPKETDVWRYFETDSSNKTQCVVCKAIIVKEYEELKVHLRDSHPNLLLELLQDQSSDVGSNDGNGDNDNTYTEVVYLEEEPSTETEIKHKIKPKSYSNHLKKRERQHSTYNSDDLPHKKAKIEEENDELTTFIKYITCLLKKLPADVFSNVQIEIINTILRANNQANAANTSQSMVFNNELVNTSSKIITVDGITPISNTTLGHHNYTITVAPPKESETEKTEINS